jgi:hypothetical protein
MGLVEVGSFALVSIGRVVLGRGKKTCETNSPAAAVLEDSGLGCDGGRQRRFMAAGLMARKSAGPTPLRHQPLGRRWLTVVCLAALRPKDVVKLAGDGQQAAEGVKGGGAQSRSLVVG